VTDGEATVVVYASAQQRTASCPRCQYLSQSIHSYYSRSPQDLPISGKTVRLVLRVRRFRCQNPGCQQRTFAERCPEVVAPHAQRTKRLTASIAHFGAKVSSGQQQVCWATWALWSAPIPFCVWPRGPPKSRSASPKRWGSMISPFGVVTPTARCWWI